MAAGMHTCTLLVADGLFMQNGSFYVTTEINLKKLQKLCRTAVLKMLKKEGKIEDDFIRMLIQWEHVSVFNIQSGVKIAMRIKRVGKLWCNTSSVIPFVEEDSLY